VKRIRERAVGIDVAKALNPSQQVIKIVYDELTGILGGDTLKINYASRPPTVVLMAGLQGSGKTTTSGKLANWLKNGGHRPLLVSVDVYRPAAREQLRTLGARSTCRSSASRSDRSRCHAAASRSAGSAVTS
jgi:signal recognition particle subunit SRP54